ncbi:uncharacterized protein LOC119599191 [Penaeus monodon]|uniref:uncharacterized protein LOC119599191 n=1 Tax=Penaeus monodon TaxID=6687 RepID=UPI0018A7D4D6|nr:uncharacterized protein LOC119599191 [Penaeus monodon]
MGTSVFASLSCLLTVFFAWKPLLVFEITRPKNKRSKRGITLGWQAFGKASAIFKNKRISIGPKTHKFMINASHPRFTYGAETWNLTKKQLLKLRSMQRPHKRIMLGVTWRDHIPSAQIREQTKIRDIL